MFNRKGTATCNCLIDVFSKLLLKTSKRDEYNKLTTDAITSVYKKVSDKISNKVNADGKKIIENKAVVNRMLMNGSNSCFISLKDHKPDFLNKTKFAY